MKRPSLMTTVFTAPRRRASSVISSKCCSTSCLHGWGMLGPLKPRLWGGAGGGGVAGDFLQMLQHQLLAWMGDVEAVIAEPVGGLQEIPDGGARQFEFGEVGGATQG